MINFYLIPKNASSTCRFMESVIKCPNDLHVVTIRNPLERFWSACKTITPELSPFGNFPFSDSDTNNPPTSYSDITNITPQGVINSCKNRILNDSDMTEHLMTQTSLIGDTLFDAIVRVESYDSDVNTILNEYNLTNSFGSIPVVTASLNDWDNEAMSIINADSDIRAYYQSDIDLYNDPSSLLKIDSA